MGMADAIVDLVSSGTTLRENNLKEIEGGVVLESQVTPSLPHSLSHSRECDHILRERFHSFYYIIQ
jgi:ATP phosphoribosyltransferase